MKWSQILAAGPAFKLLVLMLVADFIFMLLTVGQKLDFIADERFSIAHDRGYGEMFQYGKLVWIILCFGYLTCRFRQPVFAILALFFLYLLVDDAGMIHEGGGEALVTNLQLQPALGLRAQDFGELIVTGLAAVMLLILGGLAYSFSDGAARRVTHLTLAGVLLLAFFGVVVDMLHVMVPTRVVGGVLMLIEDGGEMMTMSLIAAGMLAIVRRYPRPLIPATARQGP